VDTTDREIINRLQGGFPICEQPYAQVAQQLGIAEDELITRIGTMLDEGVLSRFGPMYHAERLGGGLTLAAMQIPEDDFDKVAEQVNAFEEVAHNYQRDHRLNMWFVLATEAEEDIGRVIGEIEACTGYKVYNMPKQQEFFVGLKFDA
jgi:DNA-binding Lrp family transcriptional regulator